MARTDCGLRIADCGFGGNTRVRRPVYELFQNPRSKIQDSSSLTPKTSDSYPRFAIRNPLSAIRNQFAALLFILAPLTAAQTSRPSPPAVDEASVWQRVEISLPRPAATESYSQDFQRKADAARRRIESTQAYLRLFPGGEHRDEAVAIELAALFELGTLDGGAYAPLCQRVQQYLRNPWDSSVEEEAAYWELTCRNLKRTDPTSSAPAVTFVQDDTALVAAYREYVSKYPASRYSPQLAQRVFRRAESQSDAAQMHALSEQMQARFPSHPITEWMAGRLNLHAALGKPFQWKFRATSGAEIDTLALPNRPTLIVLWTAADRASRDLAVAIEKFRKQTDLNVLGVSTDEWRDRLDTVAQSLDIPWPQYFDGLGPACKFARTWGISESPAVLVLDTEHRLLGAAGADNWEPLAKKALGDSSPRAEKK